MVCPLSTSAAGTAAHGAEVGMGNTQDTMRAAITGAPGSPGAYARALRDGHSVHAIITETFGGFGKGAVALLYELGRQHGARLGADEQAAPWCARSFRSLHAMRVSVALHMATADEIIETVKLDVAAEAEE